jgi:hypothetical protein
MNIQNNVGKQGSNGSQNGIDYYKELKDIVKELDKVYKKLSKDETLADMINNIKNEFINKNIAHIEKNLSKPNYKEFNTKIIKILDIIIKLLRNFTSYNKDDDAKLVIVINNLINKIDYKQEELVQDIKEKFKADEDALANPALIDDAKENASDLLEIKKLICAFEYYKLVFESPNTVVAQKIKELNTDIDNLKKKSNNRTADENDRYENITKEINEIL